MRAESAGRAPLDAANTAGAPVKWEKTDFRVGAAVLMVLAMVVAAVFWLSPALASTEPLYAEFTRIEGLGVQAPVYINGYPVGRVDRIEPRSTDHGTLIFRVRMKIDWRLPSGDSLPLAVGTKARLTPPAVQLGSGFALGIIDLESPPGGGPPLLPGSTLVGVRSAAMTDQWQTMAEELSADISQTLLKWRVVMDSLTITTTAVALAANQAKATAAQVHETLPALATSIQRDLATADSVMRDMRRLSPAAVASMDSAQLLLADSRRLVTDLTRLVNAREPQLDRVLANLDTTAVLLQYFVRQVSAKPTRVFTGVKPPVGVSPAGSRVARDSLKRP
jgi:ABC-type transporter Mla subunit MlaD